MKRCPTCNRIFTEPNLIFCTDDGTPLAPIDDKEETVVNSSARGSGEPVRSDAPAAYQPPSYAVPATRRRVWPWVVGALALVLIAIVGLGIAAVVYMPRMLRSAVTVNANSNRRANENRALSNSNANVTNTNTAPEDSDNDNADQNVPPPTDRDAVLSQLTDLENEWTVANINADKKKLDRILADDYVGKSSEGKPQGKAEYLKTLERDTNIQKWNFEDLKVTLLGDRATLTGIIRLQANDREAAFNFTDKFVWRDGRWQATGSDVTPLNEENQ